jgi:YVTN family beta-propeller protein
MNISKAVTALALSATVISAGIAGTESSYQVIKRVPLGGTGFWDYLHIDSPARRLYIGRSDRVMVVDLDSEKLVGEVTGMKGVHGVCVLPKLNRGFVTSGKDNTVRVFNLQTLKEIAQVKTGETPDAITYDPSSKRIFVFNHGGTTATVIEPTNLKSGTVELLGEPEAGVSDGKGKVFVNLEDKNEIVVIDTKKLAVVNRFKLSPGTEPTGLSIDLKHRRLFSGCHNQKMVILNADTGKLITTLPIGAAVDGTLFDPETQNVFSSNGDGTLTVIHEKDPDTFEVIQTVQTEKGARTMDMDTKTHRIWLATAKSVDATDAAAEQNRHHKSIVPESFTAIEVGKN